MTGGERRLGLRGDGASELAGLQSRRLHQDLSEAFLSVALGFDDSTRIRQELFLV